jgi:hypothetical protein
MIYSMATSDNSASMTLGKRKASVGWLLRLCRLSQPNARYGKKKGLCNKLCQLPPLAARLDSAGLSFPATGKAVSLYSSNPAAMMKPHVGITFSRSQPLVCWKFMLKLIIFAIIPLTLNGA